MYLPIVAQIKLIIQVFIGLRQNLLKQTNDLIFPGGNQRLAISHLCIRFSWSQKVLRDFIAICSVLCLTLSGFAQDSQASPVGSSLTSLEFVPVHVVSAIDNSEQTNVDEQSLDFQLLEPSAGMLEEAASEFGTEDTWRWTVQFGYGMEHDDADNNLVVGGFGFSYFPIDDFSLNVEFNGMYFTQDFAAEAAGFNFNLLLRWHYMTEESWSAFLESSVGIVITDNPVPARGAGFNFIAQLGAGVSVDLGDDVRLLTGLRWHHLSNGRTFDFNPGQDSVYIFVGLSMPF